jgi:hypothetical protein
MRNEIGDAQFPLCVEIPLEFALSNKIDWIHEFTEKASKPVPKRALRNFTEFRLEQKSVKNIQRSHDREVNEQAVRTSNKAQ